MLKWLMHLHHGQSVCDDWCLHFWEVVGIWFTGTATFAAVVVSLVIARREGIRIKVSAGHRIVVGPGSQPPYPEILAITVRNVGSRPAIIEGIGWRRRPWGTLGGYQLFDPEGGHPGPPVKIEAGNRHTFKLPIGGSRQWGNWFVREMVGSNPKIGVLAECLMWKLLGVPAPPEGEAIALDLSVAEQAFGDLIPRMHQAIASRAREIADSREAG
jgi:hypothetical protein